MRLRWIWILGLLSVPRALAAGDWPQFRGPEGRGISAETGLPVEWSKDRGIRWTAKLPGRGLSSPVVAGGRVYVTACTGAQQERLHVLCYDARTGAKKWERQFAATGSTQCNSKTCMAAPTPAADAGRVFALFATGDLAALDAQGDLLWYRSLCSDYPTIGNNVGMAASPVLHEDVLLVPMENVGDSFIGGLDARTGVNLWKQPRKQAINWTTPLLVGRGASAQALVQSPELLTAYDPRTGAKRWELEAKLSSIPSTSEGGGLIFAPGGPSLALRAEGTSVSKAWESSQLSSATATPTFYKGRLYTINSAGVVSCADPKDGSVLWKERAAGPQSASPLVAEDRLYVLSEKGMMTVLGLGETPTRIAENPIDDVFLASPAAADGALYLRSDRLLYCIGK